MMFLQEYIAESLSVRTRRKKADELSDDGPLNRRRRALHDQYHVDWETQNNAFCTLLEAAWVPYQTEREQGSFEFGRVRRSSHFGEDKEVIYPYTFLRFREESGIPFFISSCHNGTKAACGAAERIARHVPFLSILALVQANEPKAVEQAITRSILNTWTQTEADEVSKQKLNVSQTTR